MLRVVRVSLFVAFAVVSGCAGPNILPVGSRTETVRRFERNYEVGQRTAVHVGQPIAKVKDYVVERREMPLMVASANFQIQSDFGGDIIRGIGGTAYPVRGVTNINGLWCILVDVTSEQNNTWGIPVKADGSVYDRLRRYDVASQPRITNVSPQNLIFTRTVTESVVRGASGYSNYELLFSGTDGRSLNLTYREYTDDDMARPAFSQNVVYESRLGQIRFRDTVIEVHEATNERIVYTIISDGLEAPSPQ